MTNRERVKAILHYENYDRLPLVAFGYWPETIQKWVAEGYLKDCGPYAGDNCLADRNANEQLGFDFNWSNCFYPALDLFPVFEEKILEEKEDGSRIIRDYSGLITLVKPGVVSIPAEIGTSLTSREAWEKEYLPRMQYTEERIDFAALEAVQKDERNLPRGLHCGSMIGRMRDFLGVEALSYLLVDDEELFDEIADTFADISYRIAKRVLETGAQFEYAHYWEDVCFKNGPLVNPKMFAEKIGPHYKRTTDLLHQYGIDIISVDCDGWIDSLIPVWMENGVNTMFPIEVGTWHASIAPWREQYGRQLRGVGGLNKQVFGQDKAAVDAEIARLEPLIALGGYIPCPDHRIPVDAKFPLVQYYCNRMRQLFG